jgi:hypothetical protein
VVPFLRGVLCNQGLVKFLNRHEKFDFCLTYSIVWPI